MTRSVIIIGAGPAGLTAARYLAKAGLADVLVLERGPEAGGLPRFCGHLGWGVFDFHRFWTGPRYAQELVSQAIKAGAEIRANTTLIKLEPKGRVVVSSPNGLETLEAQLILVATGIRETPRGPRLVSGTRPWGVTTTGALQEMVYAGGIRPFQRPIIVGTELVSFSAILTARHAGIRPVAMLEEGACVTARHPAGLVAKHLFGVPILTGTRIVSIEGQTRVRSLTVARAGVVEEIACDGVIFTGRFQPDSFVLRESGIAIDRRTGGPSIDNVFRCSQPEIFAAGNVLRPVEHAGFAAGEGRAAAACLLTALRGQLPAIDLAVPIEAGEGIRYVVPQRAVPGTGPIRLHARAQKATRGHLTLRLGQQTISARRLSVLPERRITTTIAEAALNGVPVSYEGDTSMTLSLG